MAQLKLETSTGCEIVQPSDIQIGIELARLPLSGDSFAILCRSEQTYIQTAHAGGGFFLLEYREGSEDAHFCSVRSDLSRDTVVEAFRLYAAGDPAWRTCTSWIAQDRVAGGGPDKTLLILVLLPVIAAILYWAYHFTTRP